MGTHTTVPVRDTTLTAVGMVRAISELGGLCGANSGDQLDDHDFGSGFVEGKGNYSKGAVWVAMRVPDGYIGGHANQARITTFPRNDPANCLFSDDVVSFAVKAGLYPANASADDFSFADAYDPVTFSGARFCDARVWSFFSQVHMYERKGIQELVLSI